MSDYSKDNSQTDIQSTSSNSTTSQIKKGLQNLIPTSRCDKAIVGFYFTLFLLLLIMTGTAIQDSSSNTSVGWALFSFSIILGLIAHFMLLKGGNYKKFGMPLFSLMITIMLLVSLILTKPDVTTGTLATTYITVVLFGIVSTIAAVLT
jgi:hypothetical protein